MGESYPIQAIIGNALRGNETRTRSNDSGCREPIALVKAADDGKRWFFTDNNTDVVNSTEAVFGTSPEGMIAALEVYLGLNDPRLRYTRRNNSWGDCYRSVEILECPLFNFTDISDIALIMQLVDEYGDINVYIGVGCNEYTEFKKALALGGYFVNHNSIVRKDPKQAKILLSRLKSKKKEVEATFWVQNLTGAMYDIWEYLPGFHCFKSRVICRDIFVDLIGFLFMIEGIYGKGSRYRIEPFRKLLTKWRSTPKKSHAFKKKSVAKYVQWLDREAALPDNKKPLIAKLENFDDVLNRLTRQ